jgi:hypothetical protein
LVFFTQQSAPARKALPVQVSHSFAATSAVFDDDHLVSCAGLVPVMTLANQTALPELLTDKVHIAEPKIKSGSANPAPKLATLIAAMCAGVYAPSTIGTLLREFTFGHARLLESVLREHLATLSRRVPLLPGADERAVIDIDSLLRPVFGRAKQGASYGHTKDRGETSPAQRLVPADHHDQHPGSSAGDRRRTLAGR